MSLVPFLQSKALMYFPHFYPDKFYNGSQIGEKCQNSQDCSVPYNGGTSASFSRALGIARFFSQLRPSTQYLSTGWAILLAPFSQTPNQYLLTGWEFFSVFQPSPIQCLDHEWVCLGCFTRAHPSICSTRRGQVCSTAK